MQVRRKSPVHPLDIEFAAYSGDSIAGTLILTPYYYAHTLHLHPAVALPRLTADALVNFATGFTQHAHDHAPSGGFAPAGTLFHVAPDNGTMKRFMESRGARHEDAILYHLDL